MFAPANLQSDDLFAQVAVRSPAAEAGIRDQDMLLAIGELDVTKWRTDPAVLPLGRFWNEPPGSKLELTLRRGNETIRVHAVLRQIVAADAGLPVQ